MKYDAILIGISAEHLVEIQILVGTDKVTVRRRDASHKLQAKPEPKTPAKRTRIGRPNMKPGEVKEILNYIQTHPRASVKGIAKRFHRSTSTIHRIRAGTYTPSRNNPQEPKPKLKTEPTDAQTTLRLTS